MAKKEINLNEGEKIVFKVSNVRQGFWGAYTNNLIITNYDIQDTFIDIGNEFRESFGLKPKMTLKQ